MLKKIPQEDIIKRFKSVHGEKYDYKWVDYVNQRTKVKILCREHGIFEQFPYSHFAGRGCAKCYGRGKDTEDIIKDFKKVHGARYDYSFVKYKGCKHKVDIVCPKHGVFKQVSTEHISGKGCPKCVGHQKTTEDLIKEFKEIHGDTYSYERVIYKDCVSKVNIICREHGVFKQAPSSHLNGNGCPKCGLRKANHRRVSNIEELINTCNKKHGFKYNYSLVEYVRSIDTVDIICPIHGLFKQSMNNHLKGHGCPKCGSIQQATRKKDNPPGWGISSWRERSKQSKNFDSFKVYIIKCSNSKEEFYKIGRTFTSIKHRFGMKAAMPYNYRVICEFIYETAEEAFYKELELKKNNAAFKYIPGIKFNGMYECYSIVNRSSAA